MKEQSSKQRDYEKLIFYLEKNKGGMASLPSNSTCLMDEGRVEREGGSRAGNSAELLALVYVQKQQLFPESVLLKTPKYALLTSLQPPNPQKPHSKGSGAERAYTWLAGRAGLGTRELVEREL